MQQLIVDTSIFFGSVLVSNPHSDVILLKLLILACLIADTIIDHQTRQQLCEIYLAHLLKRTETQIQTNVLTTGHILLEELIDIFRVVDRVESILNIHLLCAGKRNSERQFVQIHRETL